MSVRVRFAPSPTGFVHIGSLRTALYNYLFAKGNDGKYILRIEDTDRARYVEGAIEGMIESMNWAGVNHDEGFQLKEGQLVEEGEFGPYMQSRRLEIYQKHIKQLLHQEDAYHCFCSKERIERVREEQKSRGETPKYDGHCKGLSKEEVEEKIKAGEEYVIRLKLPENEEIMFEDMVRGKMTFHTSDIDDQVLIKSDGFPTYHFAVVVDDYLMGITHIIRGEEWVTSTPKHIHLYKSFGWDVPKYVHLPNILNKDKKKLSKRQGDVAVEDFQKKGYLPEALVNYIALIGWSPEDNQEIFTMEELQEKFDLKRVSKSGGVFDVEKLNWVNNHYIKEADNQRLAKLAIPYLEEAGYLTPGQGEKEILWLRDLMEVIKEYLDYLAQVPEKAEMFFKEEINITPEGMEILADDHIEALLEAFYEKVKIAEVIDEAFGKQVFKDLKKEVGAKGPKLFKPARVAVTGDTQGPDLTLVMKVLGREKLLKRIAYVQSQLKK